jgi:hypothetical protein
VAADYKGPGLRRAPVVVPAVKNCNAFEQVRKVCGFYLLDESERLRLEGDSSGSLAAAAKAVALLQTVDDDAACVTSLPHCLYVTSCAGTAARICSGAPPCALLRTLPR